MRFAALCVVGSGGMLEDYLDHERSIADGIVDDRNREPNNIRRKSAYRHGAAEMGFLRMRRELPLCYVAAVRCIYPSRNGTYMGYKAS